MTVGKRRALTFSTLSVSSRRLSRRDRWRWSAYDIADVRLRAAETCAPQAEDPTGERQLKRHLNMPRHLPAFEHTYLRLPPRSRTPGHGVAFASGVQQKDSRVTPLYVARYNAWAFCLTTGR